eukprot:CAMPEP_0178950864 /NCGR_PEP_ID=MMETSP0789-20121207/6891_1 /TAXON_ID=3005 /ORGANISM="Rhizosolenia setigera, Strain CCMP 1694" /LENGTH=1210 /DNA_ID=CAMNT_0020631641 /DNA_START=244 /DNA_END=3876 /DNA_ORIENTATION=+
MKSGIATPELTASGVSNNSSGSMTSSSTSSSSTMERLAGRRGSRRNNAKYSSSVGHTGSSNSSNNINSGWSAVSDRSQSYTLSPKPSLISSTTSPSISSVNSASISNAALAPVSRSQQLVNLKNEAIKNASKASHSARLSLVCVNAALQFGTRLRLSLCPAKMRRRIIKERENLSNGGGGRRGPGVGVGVGSHHHLHHQLNNEEELQETLAYLEQLQQDEASSGDEEDEEENEMGLQQSLEKDGMNTGNGAESGKLAFGRRKIAFFDMVTADNAADARTWLNREEDSLKKYDRELLEMYLRNAQNKESLMSMESGLSTTERDFESILSQFSSPKVKRGEKVITTIYPESKLPLDLSLNLVSAMITESLKMSTLESLEGMHKCYDGLVAAGTALLEEDEKTQSSNKSEGSFTNEKQKIVAALATVLVTTLEQKSGEAIVALSELRSQCGTARYRRRFTQRIAPLLVRPPNSAMWCLRHQKDMRAIIAVTELLLDAAKKIFAPGWHQKGRLLLADRGRAESLNAAARQLRSLSANAITSSINRRSQTLGIGMKGLGETNLDASGHSLTEYEVLEVDLYIRNSISGLFLKDWSKVRDIAHQQSLINSKQEGSVTYPRRERGSLSPRTKPHGLSSPLSMHDSFHSIPSSPQPPPNNMSPSRRSPGTPTASQPSYQSSSQHNRNPTQQTNKLSPTLSSENDRNNKQDSIRKPIISSTPVPMTPKPAHSNLHSTRRSSPPSRDHLLSTAPQMPLMSSSTSSPVPSSIQSDNMTRSQSPPAPAPPLSPTPSVNSQQSQRSHHSSHGSINTTPSMISHTRPSATERKRIVAACRALRAQITRFEDSFIAIHGRPPKGTLERAPLQTTYAQYREWKRAIRADAACRIQALIRGTRLRIHVYRKGSSGTGGEFYSRWKVIIMRVRRRNAMRGNLIPELPRIPVEIGDNGGISMSGGFEVTISPREKSTRDSRGMDPVERISPHKNPSSEPNNPSSNPQHRPTLSELLAEKRSLKNRLKQYDIDFHREHNRMPVKIEKEPIRHLYEQYNLLKSQIAALSAANNNSNPPSSSVRPNSGRSRSSSTGTLSTVSSTGSDSSGGTSSGTADGSTFNHRHQRRPRPTSSGESSSLGSLSSSSKKPNNDGGGTTDSRLENLKAEKTRLHQMLRAYERDFYRDHQRQVNSFADIRPVAGQYRRYKEIKKEIAALQQQEGSSGSSNTGR